MKTRETWFNMLKKEYRTKAFENIKRYRSDFKIALEEKERSMWDAIAGAFYWAETPEGAEYWSDISYNPQNYVLKKHLKDL